MTRVEKDAAKARIASRQQAVKDGQRIAYLHILNMLNDGADTTAIREHIKNHF